MSDIWKHAPDGATAIKRTEQGKMFFENSRGEYYHGTWKKPFCDKWTIIATRPTEQTKTVADEQEGEKWTHIYLDEKAYVKVSEPDCDGYILVVTEGDGYNLARLDDLELIKPKLTESAMLSRIAELARGTLSDAECGGKIRWLFDTREII